MGEQTDSTSQPRPQVSAWAWIKALLYALSPCVALAMGISRGVHFGAGRWVGLVLLFSMSIAAGVIVIRQARQHAIDPTDELPVFKQARALVGGGLSVGDAARKLGVSRSILIDAGIGQNPGLQESPASNVGEH